MRKICKNCKYWKRLESYKVGFCKNKNFIYRFDEKYDIFDKDGNLIDSGLKYDTPGIKNKLIYYDYDEYTAGFVTGEEFGCIHFKQKLSKDIKQV